MEDRYLTTPQGRIRYVSGGSGPPVILVHPLQMSASADNWAKHFEAIGQARTFYALDTLGWGFSDLLEEYSFDTWIEAMRSFCDGLGLKLVDVIGQSLGAWISQLFTWRYPDMVRRVVAIASPGVNAALPSYARGVNAALPTREMLARQGCSEPEISRILAMMDRPGKWENWNRLFDYLHDLEVREEWTLRTRLPQMKTPILYFNFDTNVAIPPKYTFEMFNLAPNSRLEISTGSFGDLTMDSALRYLQLDEPLSGAK